MGVCFCKVFVCVCGVGGLIFLGGDYLLFEFFEVFFGGVGGVFCLAPVWTVVHQKW